MNEKGVMLEKVVEDGQETGITSIRTNKNSIELFRQIAELEKKNQGDMFQDIVDYYYKNKFENIDRMEEIILLLIKPSKNSGLNYEYKNKKIKGQKIFEIGTQDFRHGFIDDLKEKGLVHDGYKISGDGEVINTYTIYKTVDTFSIYHSTIDQNNKLDLIFRQNASYTEIADCYELIKFMEKTFVRRNVINELAKKIMPIEE